MKLIRVQFSKGRHSCQSCGHTPINNLFFIRTDAGAELMVGTECAEKLLRLDDAKRYIAAAKREWKQQKPQPRDGESREDYLTRRVFEKLHARAAWQAWRVIEKSYWGGSYALARQRLNQRGIYAPQTAGHMAFFDGHTEVYVTCPKCQWKLEADKAWNEALKAEERQIIHEVEQQYQANAWDFVGVPGWRI